MCLLFPPSTGPDLLVLLFWNSRNGERGTRLKRLPVGFCSYWFDSTSRVEHEMTSLRETRWRNVCQKPLAT